jgi:hypothetical protein
MPGADMIDPDHPVLAFNQSDAERGLVVDRVPV